MEISTGSYIQIHSDGYFERINIVCQSNQAWSIVSSICSRVITRYFACCDVMIIKWINISFFIRFFFADNAQHLEMTRIYASFLVFSKKFWDAIPDKNIEGKEIQVWYYSKKWKIFSFHLAILNKLMNIFNSARLPLTQTIMIHMCCQQCRSINNLFRSYFDDVFWAPTISKLFFFNPLILKLDSSYLRLTRVKTNIFIGFHL